MKKKANTMSIANMRVHICFGPLEKDSNQLKEYALKAAGEEFDWWNVTKPARPGDMVIFYVNKPISAFVASATIARMGDCPDEKSKYAKEPCAFLRDIKLFPKQVTRAQAQQHFPEWQYLNRPTKACFPNKNTSADLVGRFLALLDVDTPTTARVAEASDIEGIMTEAKVLTRTRSRRLRDMAFNKANGNCCVCKRDFSKVLNGLGVRVLQVHHRKQLSATDAPSVTTLDDLAVVCANCHLLLHLDPKKPLEVETLEQMIQILPTE